MSLFENKWLSEHNIIQLSLTTFKEEEQKKKTKNLRLYFGIDFRDSTYVYRMNKREDKKKQTNKQITLE